MKNRNLRGYRQMTKRAWNVHELFTELDDCSNYTRKKEEEKDWHTAQEYHIRSRAIEHCLKMLGYITDETTQDDSEGLLDNLLTRREAEELATLSAVAFQYHLREKHIIPAKESGSGNSKVQLFWKTDVLELKRKYVK